ncbi:MAG: class I SAM-dependent methyltransferase [Nitrospirota bacterium]
MKPIERVKKDLSYSVRRYFVDEFFLRNIGIFQPGARILDMGGKKINKRGLFNIEQFDLKVEYANIAKETNPDYLCDIAAVPVADNSFDGVILSEVLEHVNEPKIVLQEAFRVLKPGGRTLICNPFTYHVHADPYDYGRYTDYFFRETLGKIGFKNIVIEKQGLFFSTLTNMLRLWAQELLLSGRPKSKVKRLLLRRTIFFMQRRAFAWDHSEGGRNSPIVSGYTTGYGIVCEKS